MVFALLRAWRQRFVFGHGDPAGGGGFGGLQSGGNRHTACTFTLNCGDRWRGSARCFALTGSLAAQSGSDFINSIDPLFAGVLARPGI